MIVASSLVNFHRIIWTVFFIPPSLVTLALQLLQRMLVLIERSILDIKFPDCRIPSLVGASFFNTALQFEKERGDSMFRLHIVRALSGRL